MAKTNGKAFYKSTTLWLNIVAVAVILVEIVIKSEIIPDADVLAVLVAVANIINRFRTSTAITLR